MKASINLFRICSRKTNFLSWEPGTANNHSLDIETFLQKKMIAVFVRTPFSEVNFDRTGTLDANQSVPNDPCVFIGSS